MANSHETRKKQNARSTASNSKQARKFNGSQRAAVAKEKAGQAATGILGSLIELIRSSRVALLVTIVLALVLFGGLFDFVANYGKAYSGVTVGGLDISGLKADQIEELVGKEYAERLNSAGVSIYANQDAFSDRVSDYEFIDSEDISVEEERAARRAWSTDAASLQAYIDYEKLVGEAMSIGRENPFDRLALFFQSRNIEIPLNFNEAIIESLANEIDLSIGEPLQNYGVEVVDGYVAVTEGRDGNMVNRTVFKHQITEQLLSPDADNRAFVVETEFTPVQISQEAAQACADHISDVISSGIVFSCEGREWTADTATLGSWIQTPLSQNQDGTYALAPSFAFQAARTSVLSHIQPNYVGGEGHVRFVNKNGNIFVHATAEGTFPLVGDALEELNIKLFGNKSEGEGAPAQPDEALRVELGTAEIPGEMTLEEALSFGIISPISEFETEYTSGAFERNTNIHLAADLLDNSIVPANGGVWSFNKTAGECNAEKGFLEAHAIAGNTLIDEIGGGICQVATTVFNAVYEAGYPIVERHNHTIYFSSYPQGRDAAISWPSPDLKWENNSPSDILLRMSYTDTTVKAILYGENMGYVVESEEGEKQPGAAFSTVYETDDSLYPGTEYIRTYGYDGHTVTVTRNVYDSQGELLISDEFTSVYSPQNTIIVRGPSSSTQ